MERLVYVFPNSTGGAVKGYNCYLFYQVGVLDIALLLVPASATTPGLSSKTAADHSKTIGILISCCSCSAPFLPLFPSARNRTNTPKYQSQVSIL
jgi:hypothetical protein